IPNSFRAAWNSLMKWFNETWSGFYRSVVERFNSLTQAAIDSWNRLRTSVQNIVSSIRGWLFDRWNDIRNGVTERVDAMNTRIRNAFNWLRDRIHEIISSLRGWL